MRRARSRASTSRARSPPDPEQALHWFEVEAEAGGPDVQRALAERLDRGDGVAEDPGRAFEWLQRAADAGSLDAQVALGNAHLNGRGTLRDFGKASEWFQRAAEAGSAEAQNRLGLLYTSHFGPGRDFTEAARWFRAAADQGHADAQLNLATLAERGLGMEADPAAAFRWTLRAAEGGHAKAQARAGELLREGDRRRGEPRRGAAVVRRGGREGRGGRGAAPLRARRRGRVRTGRRRGVHALAAASRPRRAIARRRRSSASVMRAVAGSSRTTRRRSIGRARRRPRATRARAADDAWEIAQAFRVKARAASSIVQLLERVDCAAARLKAVGDLVGLASMLFSAGYEALCQNHDGDAKTMLDRAVPIARELDDYTWAMVHGNLALASLFTGDTTAALHAFRHQLPAVSPTSAAAPADRRPVGHGCGRRPQRRRPSRRPAGAAAAHRYDTEDAVEVARKQFLEPARQRYGIEAWDTTAREGGALSLQEHDADALQEPHALGEAARQHDRCR